MKNKIESLYAESLILLEYYETTYPGFKSYTFQAFFLILLFEIISKAIYIIAPVPDIGIQSFRYSIAQEIDSALIFIFWGWLVIALVKTYVRIDRREKTG